MITLVLREETWSELVEALQEPLETACFLLCGTARDDTDLTLLGRAVRWVPGDAYVERTANRLSIASGGFVPSLHAAHDDDAVPVFVHTHPQNLPEPSPRDDCVDEDLCAPAIRRSGQPYYASVIIAGTPASPQFSGRLYNADGLIGNVERLRVIGRRLQIIPAHGTGQHQSLPMAFDRHIRAFGKDGQQLLSQLRVGVVGLGGTGSAVAEQLSRLGVRHLTLIDDECVTDTNLTRIHESSRADIDERKTTVAARAARAVGLVGDVSPIGGRVTDESVAAELRQLDVIFACTDDEAGRAVLARLAVWYLVPVIDMGFIIDPGTEGSILGLYGRVTTLLPGAACLLCRQHITPNGIRIDRLPPEDRKALAAEGYAPGLGDPDPSVGAFTTMTAMFAINVLLEKLFGYSPEAGASTELIIRLHDLTISRNSRSPGPGHFCGDSTKWGRGDTIPSLEMAW